MTAVSRRAARFIAIAVGGALIPVAVALACTPQANLLLSTVEVAPGDTITVRGLEFVPGGRVEIAIGGQAVGTATGPAFTTAVTIPSLGPGVRFIEATGYDLQGDVKGHASASVQVEGPNPTSPTPAGGSSGSGPSGGSPSLADDTQPPSGGSTQGAPASSSEPAAAPSPAGSTAAARRTPARSGANADRRSAARGNANARRSAGSRTGAGRPVAVVPRAPATVRTDAGQRVFAGSVAQARSSSRSRSGARSPSADRPGAPVTSPPPASARQNRGASLIPSASDPAMEPQGGRGLTLAAGAGLMGVGLVLLFGGFLVVEVRRRRAPTHIGRR